MKSQWHFTGVDLPLKLGVGTQPKHNDDNPRGGRDDLPLLPDVDAMLQQGKAKALAFEVKAGDALCFDARQFPQPKFTEQEGGISFKLK